MPPAVERVSLSDFGSMDEAYSASARAGHDHRVEAAVGDQGEDDLRAEALREARVDGLDGPLGTQGHGDGRGHQLDEERGAGLADHVAAERAAQQPDARREATQAGGNGLEDLVGGTAHLVPNDENEAARDAQDGGGDDVNDPPAEGRSSGCHAKILPSCCTAATREEPSYAGMIRIRFYGRGFPPLSSRRAPVALKRG